MKAVLHLLIVVLLSAAAAAGSAPKSKWAEFETSKIHYYDVRTELKNANKNAIIFIHGWNCNADFWNESIEAFPDYRVIAVDLPGHGQSDKPKADYTMEYFARSIEAVMKEAKVEKAVLVGHSMGTPVIRQFYRLYPEQTLGLVIVDGALRPFGPKAQMLKFFGPLFDNYQEQAPVFIDGLLGPTRVDLKPFIRTAMLAAPDYVAVSAMQGMLDDKIWASDKINLPVLAIMSSGSSWPADTREFYKAVAWNIDFQMWDGVSHFLMMEKPKEFNESLRAFIVKKKLL